MKHMLILLSVLLASCGEPNNSPSTEAEPITPPYVTQCHQVASKDLLVIGDSISLGYTPHLQDLLCGEFNVFHNEGNAYDSTNGADKIDGWLGRHFDVIIFNFGLHDLKRENGIPINDLSTYSGNLAIIVGKLKATGAQVYFITTTHIPNPGGGQIQGLHTYTRCECDRPLYNAEAQSIMNANGIDIIDLGTYSESITYDHLTPTNVHWNEAGSLLLAQYIVDNLN